MSSVDSCNDEATLNVLVRVSQCTRGCVCWGYAWECIRVSNSRVHTAQTKASQRQETCSHIPTSVTRRSTCCLVTARHRDSLSRAPSVYQVIGQAPLLPIPRSLSIFRQKGRVSSTLCPQLYSVDQINVLIPDKHCSPKPINVPFLCPFPSTPLFHRLCFPSQERWESRGNLRT